MSERRRFKKNTYTYTCSISGQKYNVTQEAKNPNDLLSIEAYYQLNPELDDRPESVKLKLSALNAQMLAGSESAEGNQEAQVATDANANTEDQK